MCIVIPKLPAGWGFEESELVAVDHVDDIRWGALGEGIGTEGAGAEVGDGVIYIFFIIHKRLPGFFRQPGGISGGADSFIVRVEDFIKEGMRAAEDQFGMEAGWRGR